MDAAAATWIEGPGDAPAGMSAGPSAARGSTGAAAVEDIERNFALATHLAPLSGILFGALFVLAPLVLWLARKDRSGFNDDHGREVVNFTISYFIYMIVLSWTVVVPLVLLVVGVVSMIRGALAASRNEYFRYPMTIRFV
jgi:hypothetical protein